MNREEYATNYPLDYFFNATSIPNQELVFMTYDHFETGPRAGYMAPLEFLNLLEFNYEFLKVNVTKPFFVLEHFKSIPISDELRHILMGFILKWYGGYPVDNFDQQYNTTLRLVEREFLKFKEETPEKKICQRDWQEYQRIREVEKYLNQNIDLGGLNHKGTLEKSAADLKDNPEDDKRSGYSRPIEVRKKKKKTGSKGTAAETSQIEQDEWDKNFEEQVNALHRREFKKVAGVDIEFTSFRQLLKDWEFNYPLKYAPLSYFHMWKENLRYFRIEVLDNLMQIPDSAKIHYLDNLKYQISECQKAAHTSEQEYISLLSKYNTNKRDILERTDYENKIFEVINAEVPSFHESMEPDFFPDTLNIQHVFYNYHYGEAIKEAISFLDEQTNTRTEKHLLKNTSNEIPEIHQDHQKENAALDNLLESLRYNIPKDKGPFESLNLWNSNLDTFFREALYNLSKQRPENKKHYLELAQLVLKEKTKNVFVTDELYDSLLSQCGFNRETVFESRDSDDDLIGSLVSTPIQLDISMGTEILHYEDKKYMQDTFYNFHYGQTLNKALEFVNKQLENTNGKPGLKSKTSKTSAIMHSSFQYKNWNSGNEKITDLMNFLKNKGFIDRDIDLASFRKLFRNEFPSRKIIWLTTITDLSYFIGKLACHPGIEESKKKHWYIAVNYFELADGSDVTNTRLSGQKKPADTTLLDNALNLL